MGQAGDFILDAQLVPLESRKLRAGRGRALEILDLLVEVGVTQAQGGDAGLVRLLGTLVRAVALHRISPFAARRHFPPLSSIWESPELLQG